MQHSRRVLFEPFRLSQWLRLGFCAFLMGSGPTGLISGGDASSPFGSGDVDGNPSGDFGADTLLPWLQEHQSLLLTLAFIVVPLIGVLALLFTWLSSRGRFMLLDGLIHNRGAIVGPWRNYRREGNSLFRFRVALGLISLGVLGLLLAGPVLVTVAELRANRLSLQLLGAVLSGVLLLLVWLLVMELISLLLLDFVAPVMLLQRLPVLQAWRVVIAHVVRPQPWGFALYVLARLLLNSAVSTLSILAVVFSCCLALVPYLGAVILLPLTLFQLSYPLAYLEKLGPQWRFFPPEREPQPGA